MHHQTKQQPEARVQSRAADTLWHHQEDQAFVFTWTKTWQHLWSQGPEHRSVCPDMRAHSTCCVRSCAEFCARERIVSRYTKMMSQPSPVNQSRTWDISSQKAGSLLSSVLSGRHIFFPLPSLKPLFLFLQSCYLKIKKILAILIPRWFIVLTLYPPFYSCDLL